MGATSGEPTWSRRWQAWRRCWVPLAAWRFRRRAPRCTCRTRWSPKPAWTTTCAAGWRSGPEKVDEVVILARALRDGRDAVADEIAASNAAAASRRSDPRLHNSSRPRPDRLDRRVGHAPRRCGRTPRQPGGAAAPAAAADHDDRLVPADVGDPQGARGVSGGRDRRGRVRPQDEAGDRRRHQAAGATRPRRAGARRAGAQRHGPVLRRATGGLLRHAERLGAVLRQPLRAPADPLRRRVADPPDDGRVDHLRAVADRQTGEGHVDRAGHDPGLVVRPRRPAAGRHRQPGGAGHSRRDRGPAGRGHRGHPGRRARAA